MHVESILLQLLDGAIHKKRFQSLNSIVEGIIFRKKLKLTDLARAKPNKTQNS